MHHLVFSLYQNYVMATGLGRYAWARKLDIYIYDWLKRGEK